MNTYSIQQFNTYLNRCCYLLIILHFSSNSELNKLYICYLY